MILALAKFLSFIVTDSPNVSDLNVGLVGENCNLADISVASQEYFQQWYCSIG